MSGANSGAGAFVPVAEIGRRARAAAAALALVDSSTKNRALEMIADALGARADEIVAANAQDVARARAEGVDDALIDRLLLTPDRIDAMAAAVRDLVALHDPIGDELDTWTLANGLRFTKRRVPLGVIGIIYEARPNVTVDAAGICLKSGNACILRGSRTAIATNIVLARAVADAATSAGLPEYSVQLIEDTGRESAKELMRARDFVDVLIPRGGADLIRTVVTESTVPVIETGVGNCHVYVDATADAESALAIVVNAKTQRPSVCNAAESLLVHREIAATFLPRVAGALRDEGVELRGDAEARSIAGPMGEATDDDWRAEYLNLTLAVRVVASIEEAIVHINAYGSHHTDAILTKDTEAAGRFAREVDSACVMINASTRFADGGEFGFGAEIGISNQKLHARGPMGLAELTSYRYIVEGTGQVRS